MKTSRIIPSTRYEGQSCEVLVIGSGTSGLSTALELASHGVSGVVVADQGDFATHEHESLALGRPAPAERVAGWNSGAWHYSPVPGVSSAVGGRSRGWYGVTLPIDARLLRHRWPHEVASRLLGDGPDSYAATLALLEEWRGEALDTPQNKSEELLEKEFEKRWPAGNLTVAPQAGRTSYTADRREFSVYTPLLAWRGSGLSRHQEVELPRIVSGLQAMRLDVRRSGRVEGATFRTADGQIRSISAPTVVLAAGTLENTRLYAQALADTGDRIMRWPGLNDHLPHGIVTTLPQPLRQAWRPHDRAFLWADHDFALRANLFVDIHALGRPEPVMDVWWLAQQEEPFLDAVIFESDDEVWTGRIESAVRPRDTAAMAVRDHYATEGLLAALSVSVVEGQPAGGTPDLYTAVEQAQAKGQALRYVNPLGHSDHEAGTIPLGSALDFGGKAPWASGLYVSGPASFPMPGAANPTLTIIALAAQTAQAIVTS